MKIREDFLKTSLIQKTALVFFGIFLSLLMLEVSMRCCGFLIVSAQNYQNAVAMKQKDVIRILCLGESTTQAGPEPYPEQLEKILNGRNAGIKFIVINKGLSGITSSYIADHLQENLNTFKPDIVITMMGVNDFASHLPREYSVPGKRPSLLEKLRTYKLFRYLWLHITTKLHRGQTSLRRTKSEELSEQAPIPKDSLMPRADILQNKETSVIPVEKNPLREGYDHILNSRGVEAEKIFKEMVAEDPEHYEAYIGLAMAYDRQGRYPETEVAYQKAIALQPENVRGYLDLGGIYHRTGREREAQKMYEKAVQKNPENVEANFQLGWSCELLGEEDCAKKQFKKTIELTRIQDEAEAAKTYGRLAVLYKEMGNKKQADALFKKANEVRLGYYDPVTRENYLKIKYMLDQRGIRLVCVQYPVRSVEPLKKIFEGETDILFVDNEKIFKDALKKSDYKEYFTDIFGGDFGHCTAKGNRLLAENIADAILKEIFHQ